MKTLPLLFAGLLANAAVPPGAANRVSGSRGPGAKLDARVPWATTSASPAPAGFERSAVLGDWKPAPPS